MAADYKNNCFNGFHIVQSLTSFGFHVIAYNVLLLYNLQSNQTDDFQITYTQITGLSYLCTDFTNPIGNVPYFVRYCIFKSQKSEILG